MIYRGINRWIERYIDRNKGEDKAREIHTREKVLRYRVRVINIYIYIGKHIEI